MSNFKPKREITHGVDEVTFKNHISEFQRFYTNHKSFCDEVSGIKPRSIVENNERKEFYITKENFVFAIRKLMAFTFDNLHYIKNQEDYTDLEQSCYKLEERFLLDEEYQKLAKKKRSIKEDRELTKRYIRYIIEVYDIGTKLVHLLQNTLMISTSKVRKDVEYHNETAFYDELSRYRTEIVDAISNFRFSDTLLQFKRILAYYYTYKILIAREDQLFIDEISTEFIEVILQEDMIKLMNKVAENQHLRKEEVDEMLKKQQLIKQIILKIYSRINKNLSKKKVLPKIEEKLAVDKTLI